MNQNWHLVLLPGFCFVHFDHLLLITALAVPVVATLMRVESLHYDVECFLICIHVLMRQILSAAQRWLVHRVRLADAAMPLPALQIGG